MIIGQRLPLGVVPTFALSTTLARADELLVPVNSAVFSAWGMLLSDLRRDNVQTNSYRKGSTCAVGARRRSGPRCGAVVTAVILINIEPAFYGRSGDLARGVPLDKTPRAQYRFEWLYSQKRHTAGGS